MRARDSNGSRNVLKISVRQGGKRLGSMTPRVVGEVWGANRIAGAVRPLKRELAKLEDQVRQAQDKPEAQMAESAS
jgi:hypothetical protein